MSPREKVGTGASAGAGRRLLPLGLVFAAVGLSTAMASPFLTLFLDEGVHANGPRTALFLSGAAVSAVIVTRLLGRWSDRRHSRGGVLLATALAGCLASGVTAVVRDYWALLLVAVTATAAAAGLMPQVFAYAREAFVESDRLAVTMSGLRSLFSISWVAGPPLAAALLTLGGFTLVFAVSSTMYGVVALVVLLALRGSRPVDARPSESAPSTGIADATPGVIRETVTGFVLARCAGVMAVQSLPFVTTRDLHAGLGSAGFVLGLCAALEIPLMLGAGVLAARVSTHRLVIAGLTCGLSYSLLVVLSTHLWELVAGQVLNAACVAALAGLGITYIQDLLPRQAGRAATLYANAVPLGTLIAGPILGLARHTGYRTPFLAGALLYTAALALLLLPRRSGRQR